MTIKHPNPFQLKQLKEINEPEKTLIKGCQLLEELEFKYWLSSGTLLGFYREGDFIPTDTDIDVGVHLTYNAEIAEKVKAKFADFTLIRTIDHDNKPMQLAYLDNNGAIFDIYFYYEEGDKLVNHNEEGVMEKPLNIFELAPYETKYGTFPAPKDIEAYLVMRYGDWQTPSNKKGLYTNDF
jgi:fukutin